jgi:hypothetical protein
MLRWSHQATILGEGPGLGEHGVVMQSKTPSRRALLGWCPIILRLCPTPPSHTAHNRTQANKTVAQRGVSAHRRHGAWCGPRRASSCAQCATVFQFTSIIRSGEASAARMPFQSPPKAVCARARLNVKAEQCCNCPKINMWQHLQLGTATPEGIPS